jgi:sirohydrochlorin cobaltochelatase
MRRGIVLFAHGARDPRWAEPFEAVAAELRRRRPDVDVRPAYLEFMAPALSAAIESMSAEGCTQVDVVPLFLGAGGHVRRDLPQMLQALRERHPRCPIALHATAGETRPVIDALAQAADELTR